MDTTIEWMKKNWLWLALGLLVIAVIVGIIRRNKKDNTLVIKLPNVPKIPGMAGRAAPPAGESSADAKAKMDACFQSTANIRLATGAPHPCAALKDAYEKAKAAEASFVGGYTENSFVGPFTPQEGLNLQAFGMGLDGTSLLMDKQV